MYFYELHEGDDSLFADLLLAREEEMEPEEFFETVKNIRERVIDSHSHDTLIEAIADELERDYEFIFISDDRLTAAVNVSRDPDENFLTELDGDEAGSGDDALDRLGDEHFTRCGEGTDARGDVNGDPSDVLTHDLELACMETNANVHPQRSHSVDDRMAAPNSTDRAIEGRDEAVADRLHLGPAEADEFSSDRLLQ